MVKRIQCRVVHSVSLTSRSSCADYALDCSANESSGLEPIDDTDPNIERILKSIYNIQSKIYNRNADPSAGDPTCPVYHERSRMEPVERDIAKILKSIYNIKCLWLRKQLSNRNARPGLVVDFVA